jgi:threonine aldolase
MVFVSIDADDPHEVATRLESAGVKTPGGSSMRLVCHLDVSTDDIDTVIEVFDSVLASAR